jgi:hypothetical protein
MMEAVSISETWVSIYQTTWCNIPEDSQFNYVSCKNKKITGNSGAII